MFRRKDGETGRPGPTTELGSDGVYPRTVAEPRGLGEQPRRSFEMAGPEPVPMAEPAMHEKKQLIVGHGISLSGEITACDRLIVLGNVQVTLNQTRAIEIGETGRFTNGRAEVEEAEISGVYEGELTVKKRLLIRSTGQVKGNVRYGELEIESGGRLSGSVAMLSETPARAEPRSPEPAARPEPRPAAA